MSLLTSLISAWELNEASGNAVDSHGSNTLTETSGTIGASTGPGGSGGSRDFEQGDTEYFTIADNTDLSTGDIDFTIEAWVNAESLTSNPVIASKGWTSSIDANAEWALFYSNATSRFRFDKAASTTAVNVVANNFGAPSTGTWYHILAWHDAANNQIGICVNDGTPNTTSTSTGVNDGNRAFVIGASILQSLYWDGLISKVRFWKRILTSGERTQLYNSGSGLAYSSFGGGTFTASAAVTIGAATASASGTFAPGTKTATATVSAGASTAAASGTFAAGTKTASVAVTVAATTVSASSTFAADTKTATVAVTAGASTVSGSGTTSDPAYTASAAVSAAPATASATAIFATVVYQANVAVTAGATTAAGTGTTSDPVYTSTAGVTVPVTTVSGSGSFSVTGVFNASAAVTMGATTASGVGTFTAIVATSGTIIDGMDLGAGTTISGMSLAVGSTINGMTFG